VKTKITILFSLFCLTIYSQQYLQTKKAVANDRASGDQFGSAVSIYNNYAIIGAYAESEDTSGFNTLSFAGSAYVFEKNSGGNWYQKQKLVPSDRTASDYFGYALSIDSNQLAIGAYEKDALPYTHAGAVYIFNKNLNGIWQEAQKLIMPDTSTKIHFGSSLEINNDFLIVGAPLEDKDTLASNLLMDAGAAYIFKKDITGTWVFNQKLIAPDRAISDFFGLKVAIDGNYAIVSAYREDEDTLGQNTLNDAGSVYIYEKDNNDYWHFKQKITASDRSANDRFGTSLALYNNIAVISTPLEDEDANGTNTKSNAGSAYIFERNANGKWIQKQKIVNGDRAINDFFGISVDINQNQIIVGAEQESEDENGINTIMSAGSAYVFEKNTNGLWIQKQKIVASDRGTPIDLFGHAVAIFNSNIIVGAHFEDEDETGGNPLNGSGSAYIFEYCNPTTAVIYDTACYFYASPSGNYVWNNSGTYYDTIINTKGCDSLLTIHLHILNLNMGVAVNGATLNSNTTNVNYQWVDCNNNFSPILGATNQNYTAIANGDYAVIVANNFCIDTSACYNINSVGINNHFINDRITLTPNPNNGKFTIQGNNITEIIITDIFGKIIYKEKSILNTIEINLDLATGIYIATISIHENIVTKKLIIK